MVMLNWSAIADWYLLFTAGIGFHVCDFIPVLQLVMWEQLCCILLCGSSTFLKLALG